MNTEDTANNSSKRKRRSRKLRDSSIVNYRLDFDVTHKSKKKRKKSKGKNKNMLKNEKKLKS